MKKIILLILIITGSLSIKAQSGLSISEKIDSLYDDYYTEYFYGSIPLAEKKAYKLIRATTLHNLMLWGIAEGNTSISGSALSALNTMFGESYSLPVPNFSETNFPYFDGDSIRLAGMTEFVDDLISEAEVIALINENPTVDSSFVTSSIEDSLTAFEVVVVGLIADSTMTTGEIVALVLGNSMDSTEADVRILAAIDSVTFIEDDAVQDSTEVANVDKSIKVYDRATGNYYDFFDVEKDSSVTVTDSTVSVNVRFIKTIYVNDAEDCAIFGFSGGLADQSITVVNKSANVVILKNNSTGTQKIQNGGDLTITADGGAILLCDGTEWTIVGKNE